MPVPRKHLELGIDQEIEGWMVSIYRYLSKEPEKAFSQDELIRDVLAIYKEQEPSFLVALEKLAEIGAAEAGRVKGVLYYALGSRPLEEVLGKS